MYKYGILNTGLPDAISQNYSDMRIGDAERFFLGNVEYFQEGIGNGGYERHLVFAIGPQEQPEPAYRDWHPAVGLS